MFLSILCKNELTDTILPIASLSNEDDGILRRALAAPDQASNQVIIVKHENYTFAALQEISYVNEDGETVKDTLSVEYLRLVIDQIYNLINGHTGAFVEFSHDMQSFVGAARAYSEVVDRPNLTRATAEQQLDQINALANLFALRAAYYRYITEGIGGSTDRNVNLGDKMEQISELVPALGARFDRVARKKTMGRRDVTVAISDFFDFLPLTLTENAVKYSPKYGAGVVFNTRLANDGVLMEVGSMGQQMREVDKQSLFLQRRFRGAGTRGITGTGAGLYLANVGANKLFGGRIRFRQGPPKVEYDNKYYCETVASIFIPENRIVV